MRVCRHLPGLPPRCRSEGLWPHAPPGTGTTLFSSCLEVAATVGFSQFEGNLMIIQWYFVAILILISLTTSDFEALFKCLFPI